MSNEKTTDQILNEALNTPETPTTTENTAASAPAPKADDTPATQTPPTTFVKKGHEDGKKKKVYGKFA